MNLAYDLFILTALIVVLIYLSAWFSGTETALTNLGSADIAEMQRNKERNTEYILKLKRDMNRSLVTILIGNNLVNIILSAVAALVANALFHTIGVTIMIAILTFLIIIFGEITPKSYSIINSQRISQKHAKLLYYLMQALNPLVIMFLSISQKLLKMVGSSREKSNLLVSDESIKGLATLGEAEGVIKSIERDIIHKVFLFGDKKIEEIMVPISEVFYLDKDYTIQEAAKIVAERGFTRVPIIDEKQRVMGILYNKDLLGKKEGRIKPLLKSPFIVSLKNDITDVFDQMRKKRIHIAIVRDENNRHIGMVTLEDIIEELLGEIYDEHFEVKFKKETKKKI
jgi:putative hemolysin